MIQRILRQAVGLVTERGNDRRKEGVSRYRQVADT